MNGHLEDNGADRLAPEADFLAINHAGTAQDPGRLVDAEELDVGRTAVEQNEAGRDTVAVRRRRWAVVGAG